METNKKPPLDSKTASKMLKRFILKQYSEAQLAKLLHTNSKTINAMRDGSQIVSNNVYYALVDLFCRTKWDFKV